MEIELSSGTPADLHPVVGARRGLVIAPDLMGVESSMDDMAARFAATQNWNVIVVEPFRGRQFKTNTTDERHAVVGELDDDDVVGDLVDAANRLEVEPVALIGFCMGGMYTFKASASHRFDRLVSFYGMIRIPERWHGPGQREPLQLLKHAEDPANILAIIGTRDSYTPPEDVQDLEGVGVEVAKYEGARARIVHDPTRPSHNAAFAADAWSKMYAHLAV